MMDATPEPAFPNIAPLTPGRKVRPDGLRALVLGFVIFIYGYHRITVAMQWLYNHKKILFWIPLLHILQD